VVTVASRVRVSSPWSGSRVSIPLSDADHYTVFLVGSRSSAIAASSSPMAGPSKRDTPLRDGAEVMLLSPMEGGLR